MVLSFGQCIVGCSTGHVNRVSSLYHFIFVGYHLVEKDWGRFMAGQPLARRTRLIHDLQRWRRTSRVNSVLQKGAYGVSFKTLKRFDDWDWNK